MDGSVGAPAFPAVLLADGSVGAPAFPAALLADGSVDVPVFPAALLADGSVGVPVFPDALLKDGSVGAPAASRVLPVSECSFRRLPCARPACSDGFLTLPDSRLIGVTVPPGVVLLVGSPLSDVLRTDAELLFPDGLPAEAGAPFPDGLLPRPSFARVLPAAFPSLRTVRFRAF